MAPQASKKFNPLSPDHYSIGSCKSNGIDSEQVSGPFSILTISSLFPPASGQSEKRFLGGLAEPVRPHGFAISETQLQVFILNASRRLFSDRFFTSSFRPEFYTKLGVDWVNKNGMVTDKKGRSIWCSKKDEVSPLTCVLRRTISELETELEHVVNAFEPWERERGEYCSLKFTPRKGAESDLSYRII